MIFLKLKILFIVSLLLLLSGVNFAQSLDLFNQVIGSNGNHYSGNNLEVSYTVGEVLIETGASASTNTIATQGFHQPLNLLPLSFEYKINTISCTGINDGNITITNVVGCSPPYQIVWSNGQTGLQATNLSPDIYQVTVTSGDCVIEKEIELTDNGISDCKLIFYTGFTPNGDDKNNYWIIDNIELEAYKNNTIQIFNRWGKVIWQGENYNNTSVVWKGLDSNGAPLATSTYFYTMTIGINLYKGFIELTK